MNALYLYKLTGLDAQLLKQCNSDVRSKLWPIAMAIPLVFTIYLISFQLAFSQLLRYSISSIFAAVLMSFIFTNIYRFLLLILISTKTNHHKVKQQQVVITSIAIIAMVYIASLPIAVALYNTTLQADIEVYKQQLRARQAQTISYNYHQQTQKIKYLFKTKNDVDSFQKNQTAKQAQALASMNKLINQSNYYLKRIHLLSSNYPFSFLIFSLNIFLFVLPLFFISKLYSCSYFNYKHYFEHRLITLNYYAFRKKYSRLFRNRFGKEISYYESYSNPPFNTLKKEDTRSFEPAEVLLKNLYYGNS